MRSHVRVAVVGGGIGGLSALYHLTQEGWTDVVLLERNELDTRKNPSTGPAFEACGAVRALAVPGSL